MPIGKVIHTSPFDPCPEIIANTPPTDNIIPSPANSCTPPFLWFKNRYLFQISSERSSNRLGPSFFEESNRAIGVPNMFTILNIHC